MERGQEGEGREVFTEINYTTQLKSSGEWLSGPNNSLNLSAASWDRRRDSNEGQANVMNQDLSKGEEEKKQPVQKFEIGRDQRYKRDRLITESVPGGRLKRRGIWGPHHLVSSLQPSVFAFPH